jgi:hypothetical protein
MQIQFRFDPDLKILFAKGSGIISLDDLLEYGKKVLEIPGDLTGAIEYVDFSETKDIAVSYQSAQHMLDVYKQWMSKGIAGSVLYAPTDVCYGMARMIGAVLSSVSGNPVHGPLVTREPISPENLRSWLAEAMATERSDDSR